MSCFHPSNNRRRLTRLASHKRRETRLCLEKLEDRLALSTFTVVNAADNSDPGSLRWAITQANNTAGADIVNFDSAVFNETRTIRLTSGEMRLTDTTGATTIQGPGADLLTISGGNYPSWTRVFGVASGVTASISGLTITRGYATVLLLDGGGIYNAGTLTVTNTTLSDNSAGRGGGIYNAGTLSVTNTTLTGNKGARHGGGIYNAGALTVVSSTLSGNSTNRGGGGGGIYNAGTLMVTSSTLSGNSASRYYEQDPVAYGGGIYNDYATATVTSSTITGNSAFDGHYYTSSYGGGIYNNYGTLTVTSSTISNNSAIVYVYVSSARGGGIYNNSGSVEVINSTLSDNTASTASSTATYSEVYGGGIYNYNGPLTVTSSTLSGNSASSQYIYTSVNGGGIYNDTGEVTVTSSTLSDNSASSYFHGRGGGIYNKNGPLTVTNSTLSGNSASATNYGSGYGGGIYNDNAGTLTVTSSTISDNSAYALNRGSVANAYAGGIYNNDGGTLWVTSSIVAANNALYDPDVSGWSNPGGNYNLIGVNPLLAPLGWYGGPTQTMALLPGSPALNAGNNNLAVDPNGGLLEFDQRGSGFPRIVGDAVDIGAFEVQNQPPIATDDAAATGEDVSVVVVVLTNDVDPDGDPLTVTDVADPANGSVAINPDGTIMYKPEIDFHGVDSFMYTLSDGNGGTDMGTVTITVLSADEQIDVMLEAVQQLVDAGAANKGQGNALSVKLLHIQEKIDAGQKDVALNQLSAFTNQATDLIEDGVLTPEQGQTLLNAADDLRASLTVTSKETAVDLALVDGLLDDFLPGPFSSVKPGKKK